MIVRFGVPKRRSAPTRSESPSGTSLPKLRMKLPGRGALQTRADGLGADRILFSNGYPYEDYAEGGEFIDTVAISESARRKIAYGNAKALYKL